MPRHECVVLFYKYFVLEPSTQYELEDEHVTKLYEHQVELCSRLRLRGRVLLSREGVNGTVSAENRETLECYISEMESFDLFQYFQPNHYDRCRYLYCNIDWKVSTVDDGILEPFPDIKIRIVNEIVSTGGSLSVKEIPYLGGQHLTPKEFHETIQNHPDVVLIDVRNTFEHHIGHFVNPHTKKPAIHPNMVAFSSFDATFCSKKAKELQDKKVLLYCTGGIRCEKASAILKKRGVQDVSQLTGGIVRYMERYGDQGFFKGKNFVFDQRVALQARPILVNNDNSTQSITVGRCVECSNPYDDISGSRICTVCRDLVLVCEACQSILREYHCERHSKWKHCYFTFLDIFSLEELQLQQQNLIIIRDSLIPPSEYKNLRRTLSRQILKAQHQIDEIMLGTAVPNKQALRHCRTCMESEDICDGLCFGFWKHRQLIRKDIGNVAAAIPIAVGDRVAPGIDWNPLRLGSKNDELRKQRTGTVVAIKSWASEGDENDCVEVIWDDILSKQIPEIYRWGFIARNGRRMYDVQKLCN